MYIYIYIYIYTVAYLGWGPLSDGPPLYLKNLFLTLFLFYNWIMALPPLDPRNDFNLDFMLLFLINRVN